MFDRGWFKIDNVQDGDRTPAEQMLGLQPIVQCVRGKSVLDLGCAEGVIGHELLRAGAASVDGVETNLHLVARAPELAPGVRIYIHNLNNGLPEQCSKKYDIILMLAIIHKLEKPEALLRQFIKSAVERIAIRLPLGSTGQFLSKQGPANHQRAPCDVNAVMESDGWRLEQVLDGPRGELVQHWIKGK